MSQETCLIVVRQKLPCKVYSHLLFRGSRGVRFCTIFCKRRIFLWNVKGEEPELIELCMIKWQVEIPCFLILLFLLQTKIDPVNSATCRAMHPPQKTRPVTGKQGNPRKISYKKRCDEECLIQELLIQKSGESPAQIAVSAGHKSAGIVSIKVFCIETQSV